MSSFGFEETIAQLEAAQRAPAPPKPKYSEGSETDHLLSPEKMGELKANSAAQCASITVQKVNVPTPSPKFAFILDHVFSSEECQALIEATENLGYGIALLNVGVGVQQH